MVNLDGQAVMDWRNEMMKIPGSQFISLMHLYLGEIKTPYRKETLLSAVSEFFKNQDVRNDLFARLDGTDSVIISAICLLKFATEKKLSVFLGRIIAPEFLLDRLNNLKARLLIYEKDFKGQRIYALNPIFPELEEFREDWKIFPSLSGGDNNVKDISYTSAFIPETLELFIAVFLFFTGNEGVLFKSNGEPKKKFLETAEGIFPGISQEIASISGLPDFPGLTRLNIVLDSLCNLGLLCISETGGSVSSAVLEKFSALSSRKRLLYFLTGTAGLLSKTDFLLFEESLESVFDFIKDNDISPGELSLLFFCIYNNFLYLKDNGRGVVKEGRFSTVLRENSGAVSGSDPDSVILERAEKIFRAAFAFGILKVESGAVRIFEGFGIINQPVTGNRKSVIVESVFSVLVFPGICFANLVKILPFLRIHSFQTVASFSLTRDSVFSALSKGYSNLDFISDLGTEAGGDLPSNFLFSFKEWVADWNGSLVYSGPVFVVEPEKKELYECNKGFMDCVKKILAPGVFLLKGKNAVEAAENVKKNGFEAFVYPDLDLSSTPDAKREGAFNRAGTGVCSGDFFTVRSFSGKKKPSANWSDSELTKAVEDNADICPEQKKIFFKLIRHNLILSPVQVNPFAVPFQVLEVSGMDYPGKMRILENSLKKSSPVRVTVNDGGVNKVYEGRCVRIGKDKNEVELFVYSEKLSLVLFLARISKVEEIPEIAGGFF